MTRRPDIRKLYLDAAHAAAAEHAERRRLVLGFDDLAKRLTVPPIGFKQPGQWAGFIPPRLIEDRDGMRRNDSPVRVHLVAIVREAMARTYGEQAARAWLDETNTDRWSPAWSPHHAVEGD